MNTQFNASDYVSEEEAVKWETGSGVRNITMLNPDTAKNSIDIPKEFGGGVLGSGGFSAKASSNPYPFGVEAQVPHGTNTDTEIVSRVLRNVVILGWAPNHLILEGRPNGKDYATKIVHGYAELPVEVGKNSPYKMKVRTELRIYFVFLDDPDQKIHSLTIRGNSTRDSQIVLTQVKNAAAKLSGILTRMAKRGINLGVYSLPVTLSVGKQRPAGTGDQTGQITPLVCDLVGLTDEQLLGRLLPVNKLRAMEELSRQVKTEVVDATDWKGQSLPDLIAGGRLLLPAPVSVEDALPADDDDDPRNILAGYEPVTNAPVAPVQKAEPVDPDSEMPFNVFINDIDKAIPWISKFLTPLGMTSAQAAAKLQVAKLADCSLKKREVEGVLAS